MISNKIKSETIELIESKRAIIARSWLTHTLLLYRFIKLSYHDWPRQQRTVRLALYGMLVANGRPFDEDGHPGQKADGQF